MVFSLSTTSDIGRRGTLTLGHGTIETPFFMPVGTAGAMKGLTHNDLLELGAQILLCNTYHLLLHPGDEVIKDAGGLHEFIGWDKPILTDSGGFQVYSLRGISKIEEHGVHFQSHKNGDRYFIGPEEAMRIQHNFDSDMIMVFDECPPSTAKRSDIQKAVDRTLRWAKKCKEIHDDIGGSSRLFAIVQGGLERDLREFCAQELIAMDFDGYAIGGLAVGESEADMYGVLDSVCPLLPEDKPRYLMGVGEINQLKTCVSKGIDMFDCVLPMRIARHGSILMSDGSQIRIQGAQYKDDHSIIDPHSPSALSRHHKKNFLHHLFKCNERLGETIACAQNLGITLQTMQSLRENMEKER